MAHVLDALNWVCNIQYGIVAKGGGGQQSSGTQTTVNSPPPEVLAAYKDVLGKAQGVAAQPLQQYQNPLVAGFTPQQTSAFNTINDLQGIQQPYYNAATNLVGQSTGNIWNGVDQFSPENVNKYQNPYTQDVISSTLDQMNQQDAMQQQQLKGNAISQGAWGGDRAGVAQAVLQGQQGMNRNQTIANLNNQNYQQALGQFNQQQGTQLGANQVQAGLQQQGANSLAGLGNQALNSGLAGAGAQLQAGTLQQQLGQQVLNVPYQQFQQQQAYPFQTTQFLSNIATGIGGASGGTSTASGTTPAPNPWSQALGTGLGILGTLMMKDGGDVPGYAPGGSIYGNDFGIPDINAPYIPLGPMGSGGGGGMTMPTAQLPKQEKPEDPMAAAKGALDTFNKRPRKPDDPSLWTQATTWLGNHAGSGTPDLSAVANKNAGSPMAWSGIANTAAPAAEAITIPAASSAASMAMPEMMGEFADIAPFFMMNRGGSVPRFAGGGLVRVTHPRTGQAAMVPPSVDKQLELYERAGNTVASDKLFAQYASKSGFAGGGTVLPHYAAGGLEPPPSPFDIPDLTQSPVPGMQGSPADTPAGIQVAGMSPDQALAAMPQGNLVSQGQPQPAPQTMPMGAQPPQGGLAQAAVTPPANDPSQPVDIPDPQQKVDPWSALANAGFAMAAGTSPNAITNIAGGAQIGLKNYADQKINTGKEARELTELKLKNRSIDQNLKQLQVEADRYAAMMKETANYHQQEHEDRVATLAQNQERLDQGKFQINPVTGELYDVKTGKALQQDAAPEAVDPATGTPLKGAEFYNSLPKSRQNLLDALNEGRQNFPTGLAAARPIYTNPKGTGILDQLYRAYPEASAQTAPAMRSWMNNPQKGTKVRAINAVVEHLDTLGTVTDALQNGNVQAINSMKNAFKQQFGSPIPTNVDAVKDIVADEIVNAIVASKGALADRNEAKKTLAAQMQSPEQIVGVINQYKSLMGGQYVALDQQYKAETGRKDFDRMLTPKALDTMKLAIGQPGPQSDPDNIPVFGSKSDPGFDKLPSGAQFKTKDGTIMVKH